MSLLKSFLGFHLRRPAATEPAAAGQGPPPHEQKILDWVKQGLPVPPPHAVKQAVVRNYARRFGTRILVETGTYFGAMVEAMKHDFAQIYSIELSEQLHENAKKRFRGEPGITLIQGDSGKAIKSVLEQLTAPALFWLDGHWSDGVTARGDSNTPVREEMEAILAAAELPHVILIDDARLFGADPAYPAIDELRQLVAARRPRLQLSVDVDIIRIHPPLSAGLSAASDAS